MKNVITAIIFYMIIGFLWLSYIDAHGLKVWITKAAVMLSVLGIINTAFLGILSLKPFSIPVLESSLKVCVQILMADVLFVVIRTQAEKMFYESDPGSIGCSLYPNTVLQFLAVYFICFLLIFLTRKWWRMRWNLFE